MELVLLWWFAMDGPSTATSGATIADQLCPHVTAPTLIMGDVGDPNVPLINSYEWYHALRDAGVEVEFFAYPVDTHFSARYRAHDGRVSALDRLDDEAFEMTRTTRQTT